MEFLPIGVLNNSINFAEYVPCEKGYNTVVYVHKSVLEKQNQKEAAIEEKHSRRRFFQKFKRIKKKQDKESQKQKTEIIEKIDKSIQFDEEVIRNDVYSVAVQNDPLLEHTIQMAKNIVPLIIRSGNDPTVCFTLKNKKPKKKAGQDNLETKPDVTYKKERSKRVIETYKNDKMMNQRESLSIKETVSFSSTTLDELQYPPSCCSLSDLSEKRQRKNDRNENKPKNNPNVVASDSLQALANEVLNNSGDAKLKIHLMNDTDKNLLADKIRIPVLNAIRDCISEMIERNDYSNKGLENVQGCVQSNTEKLDGVLYRLANIEQKLDYVIKEVNSKPAKSPRNNVSTLEQLGEDIKENNSDDGEYYNEREKEERRRYDYERQKEKERKKAKIQSNVVPLTPRIEIETIDKGHETGGCGEDQRGAMMPPGTLLSAPERQTRIPARYCWTDATRQP